jgi:hypothetical protein
MDGVLIVSPWTRKKKEDTPMVRAVVAVVAVRNGVVLSRR